MRILPPRPDTLAFRLSLREHTLLLELLENFPLLPEEHHTMSQSLAGAERAEHEALLRAALAEHRQTLAARLREWLAAPGRWRALAEGRRWTVPRVDVEWLLQVFNELRVGAWARLGSPDPVPAPEELAPDAQRFWAIMEISGQFQMALLDAAERPVAPEKS